jgi:hypothetical protein
MQRLRQENLATNGFSLNNDGLERALKMTKITLNIAKGCESCSTLIKEALKEHGYTKNGGITPKEDRPYQIKEELKQYYSSSDTTKGGRPLVMKNLQMSVPLRETAYLFDDTSGDSDTYHSLHPSQP